MARRNKDTGDRRQRTIMATDLEWERVGLAASERGMDRSRYLIHRALAADLLPEEVVRRAVRQTLTLSLLEERRLRDMGAGTIWEEASAAVDDWMEREGAFERLTDPGAMNRWKKAATVPHDDEERGE